MSIPSWFLYSCIVWIAFALILLPVQWKVSAPYGRHSRRGWGWTVPNRWAWFWMELPALLIFPIMALNGTTDYSTFKMVLIGMWTIHYVHRTLIFPFRIRTRKKRMPILVVLFAVLFNSANGFLNGYYLGYISSSPQLSSWLMVLAVLLFFVGMAVNMRSDYYLISLRSKNEEYQIPRAGLFSRISCPNHFGELLEWLAFALCAFNPAAWSFFIWTAANLIPRAHAHHKWYKEKFEDYPKDRKAVIPFIL